MPFPLPRRAQIDTSNQQRKFLPAQLHAALLGTGPVQSPLFHPARANPQAVAVEEKNLHAVPSSVGEKEQMAGSGILLELAHDKSIEAIKA